jgi:hypothetical protein
VRAVLNGGTPAHRAQLRVHICSAVPAQVTMTCARLQPQPTLACVENTGLGTPQLPMSEGAVAAASVPLAASPPPVSSRKYDKPYYCCAINREHASMSSCRMSSCFFTQPVSE